RRAGGRFVVARDPEALALPRFRVTADTTAASLLSRLAQAVPQEPDVPNLLGGGWLRGGEPLQVDPGEGIDLQPAASTWSQAVYRPGRTLEWRDYRVRARVDGLG